MNSFMVQVFYCNLHVFSECKNKISFYIGDVLLMTIFLYFGQQTDNPTVYVILHKRVCSLHAALKWYF